MDEKLNQQLEQLDSEFIDEFHIKRVPEQAEDIDEWFHLIKRLISDNAERLYDEVKDLLVKMAAFIGKRDCELLEKQLVGPGTLMVVPIHIDHMSYAYSPLDVAVDIWNSRYEDLDWKQNSIINKIINDMKNSLKK